MRLAVTGREGQVVSSLIERAALRQGMEVIALGRPYLNLLDPGSIQRSVAAAKPDVVVSAAAYTAVDQAEDDAEAAYAVNATGAGAVASAAAKAGVPVIHLSTDYVFAGDAAQPYDEADATGPVSVYGQSKLAGEQAVAEANPRHVILRTAWVYSPFGKNFAKTMLRLAKDRDRVRVVSDQWGNPTSALDIADGILDIARAIAGGQTKSAYGVFHMTASGSTNWSGFAEHIFSASRAMGGPFADVEPIPTSAYPTRATRPANSQLSCEKLAAAYGVRLPDWRDSANQVVGRLIADGAV